MSYSKALLLVTGCVGVVRINKEMMSRKLKFSIVLSLLDQ